MTKLEGITIYSTKELADMLNVTTVSIRNYIKNGDFKAQKFAGRWCVGEEEVNKIFSYEEINKTVKEINPKY